MNKICLIVIKKNFSLPRARHNFRQQILLRANASSKNILEVAGQPVLFQKWRCNNGWRFTNHNKRVCTTACMVHTKHSSLAADHKKEAAGAYLRITLVEVTKLKKERFFLIGGRILIRIRTKNHGCGSGYGRRTNLRILRIRIRIQILNTVSPLQLFLAYPAWLFHACIQVSERTRTNTQEI